jgi:tetratricopeptide (TPR) repeat protein
MSSSSSSNRCSSFDPQVNNGSVIIKPSRSLRHLRQLFGRKKKHYYSSSKYSGGTAISTVCSLEEQQQQQQQHQLVVDHPTISTTNGTEAILDPQQESQYLYSQGVEQYAQGHAKEATESLTQALSIADGLELEPKILWTLVSFHAQQEEFEQAATYVTVLKPLLAKIQETWIQQEASLPLLSLLMETKLWNMAWTMSQYLPQDNNTLDPTVLARIHFEVARCLTTTSSTEQALPHLKEALELVQDRDEPRLKQAILQNMVHAHAAEEEWDEALSFQESYMESIIRGGDDGEENPIELAQGQYDAAQLYLAMEEYDDALSCLNAGLQLVPSKHGLFTNMLQAKAHVLLQLGNVDESLAVYKSLCPKLKQPSDIAKIYYTMACICRKNGRHDESLAYFKSELNVTKSAAALGKHRVETTCRIYHDMARIHDECLGDYETSLKYYAKALKVQQRALKKCTNPVEEKELLSQILETQQCMGRIHYKRGEFTQALNVSFQENVAV